MKFRTYSFDGRDVLAVPLAPDLRVAGIRAIPGATARARAYRSLLRGLLAVGADGLLGADANRPLPRRNAADCLAFARVAEELLGCEGLVPLVVYPRQRNRRRLYVHLVSPAGELLAFAKLSGDPTNDELLAREGNALRRLARASVRSFRFPSLLAEGTFEGRRYLLTAPLPAAVRQVRPRWNESMRRLRVELAGEERTVERLDRASWWPAWVRCADASPALANASDLQPDRPFRASAAHGDLVSWNVFQGVGESWLVDWENYAPDAPVLADELRFFLGIHTRTINTFPSRSPRLVSERFGCRDTAQLGRVIRALAFLQTRDVLAATIVCAYWSEVAGR